MRPLLLLLLLLAAVASGAAQDAAASTTGSATATVSLYGSCHNDEQCSVQNSICDLGFCLCMQEFPIYNGKDRCLKSVKLNETCEDTKQCQYDVEMAKCVDGRCDCVYNTMMQDAKGELQCGVQGERDLGEECKDTSECMTPGAVCGDSQCRCDDELTLSNGKCGKGVPLDYACSFNEQCTASLSNTVCKNSTCSCKDTRVPYVVGGVMRCLERGNKKIGDNCNNTLQCGYDHAWCKLEINGRYVCGCRPDFPANNYLDICGPLRSINQSCTFLEQCELTIQKTSCQDGVCKCIFGLVPTTPNDDGKIVCGTSAVTPHSETHVDPAMIGVLVGMALMFVILCVVLRLFSKARWRENRTIFNTPNPRLMNVSLLRDSKLLHSGGERRGSRASVRAPSRQPSMASLRPQSPSQSLGSRTGSRRGSRSSSNASGTSTKSPKSPTRAVGNNTSAQVLENVTVEVQAPKV